MRARTTVEARDGRPVVVRTGDTPLEAVARRLAAVAGPGVPSVLEVQEDATGFRLVTTFAPTLALSALDRRQLASSFAELAMVLARAHGAGVAHGPIEVADIRVDGGQIQLDGWGDEPPDWAMADDVASLGHLLAAFSTDEALRNIAARATTTDALARPAAASLASALLDVGGAAVRRRTITPRRAAAASAIAVSVLLAVAVAHHRGPAAAAEPRAAGAPARVAPATSGTTAPRPSGTPSDAVVEGNTVVRAGVRWRVGRPGDVVVIGDWMCGGTSTPAVLRPANGRIWRFTRWSDDGRPIAGQPLATVPGATQARVVRSGSCDRLEVLDASGQSTSVG